MKYDPNAPEEKRTWEPFPPGEYDYTIDDAKERTSSAGNEMIELTLHIFNAEGHKRIVSDYIVNSAVWKIKQCAASCGLMDEFSTGELEAYYFVGKSGRVKIKIETSDQYGDKNKVAAYVKEPSVARAEARAVQKADADSLNDEIPF